MKRYLHLSSPPSSLEDRRGSCRVQFQQLIDDVLSVVHGYRQAIASLDSCVQPVTPSSHDVEQALVTALSAIHTLQSYIHLLAAMVADAEQFPPASVLDDPKDDDWATLLASVHHLLSSFSDLQLQGDIVETMLAGLRTCCQTMEQAPARNGATDMQRDLRG